MPKELTINPTDARAKSFVDFTPIPVNQNRAARVILTEAVIE